MRKKKYALSLMLLVAVFAIGLEACSSSENTKNQPSESTIQPVESANQSIPSASQSSPVSPSKTDEIKDTARKSLADVCNDENILSIFADGRKIEVKILADFEPEDNPPDEWENICNNMIQSSVSLQEALKEFDLSFVILYLVDTEDNNILSIINSSISYSMYEEYNIPEENAPTISLAEFNSIKNGMGFQEVFDIIGSRGEVISEVDLGLGDEYITMMFEWDGEGSLGANANVTFQGGKVIGKAQFGLE